MKKLFILVFLFACTFVLQAQYSLRLVVTSAATKKLDDIYIAGSFNNWNPGDSKYKLKPFGATRKAIVLKDLPAGKYEFKFTRGNWKTVETTAKGEAIANRVFDLTEDASADITIDGWADDYPDKPKPNTATAQVKVIDTAFKIPQLNRTRRIWVYLPRSYNTTKGKTYPVLYMHDGQNLFNEQTAPFGEWGVDEALDSLQQQTGKECIVVGIDNSNEKRMNEYNPFNNEKFGKGEGDLYVDFLVKTLKPYIDKNFRTQKDAARTFIAGSSMGGLISLYALVKYPDVFGTAGIFSPAFWIVPELYPAVEKAQWKTFPRFYFYAGKKESNTMVSDMERMANIIEKKSDRFDVRRIVYPLGEHNEKTWRKEFPDFYKWLMR
jgi:predicted alpha/beta superfamily hydrolase